MKIKHIILLVIIALVGVIMVSCTRTQPSQIISFLGDTTEAYFKHISTDEFKELSILNRHPNASESSRIRAITELSLNPIYHYELPAVTQPMLGNEVVRRKLVTQYFTDLDSTLMILDSMNENRAGSVIYPVMAEELKLLSQAVANRKVLIVSSDLMERSFVANFYAPQTFYQLRNKRDKVIEHLQSQYPLPELSGVEVFFIYQPQTVQANVEFLAVSGMYKEMLEAKGATVQISANLPVNNQKSI